MRGKKSKNFSTEQHWGEDMKIYDVKGVIRKNNIIELSVLCSYNILFENDKIYLFDKEWEGDFDDFYFEYTMEHKEDIARIENGEFICNNINYVVPAMVFEGKSFLVAAEDMPTTAFVNSDTYKKIVWCKKILSLLNRKVMHIIYYNNRGYKNGTTTQIYKRDIIRYIVSGKITQAKSDYKDEYTESFIEWLGDWGVGLVSDGGRLVMNGNIPLDLTGKIK